MRLARTLSVVVPIFLAGCGSELEIRQDTDIERTSDPDESAEAELRRSTRFDAEFEKAAQEFNVPSAVLKAVSFVETRYEMVVGESEFEGQPAAYGLMGLKQPELEQGAALAGVTADQAKAEPLANVRAAAALLSQWADEKGIARDDVRNWAPVVARLSGSDDPEVRRTFVNDEVFSTLKLGVGRQTEDLVAAGQSLELEGELGTATQELSTAPDYAKAVWRPSPNFNARPSGTTGQPKMVIIHTCEGAYSGCWGWLQNPKAGASAHYVVNSTGSEVSQLIREKDRAWHISATYECSRNSSKECWLNGNSSNNFTVGIEHAGYASQSSFSSGMIDASAQLTCDITKQWGIPRDSYHIVGHGKLQPYNRTDPGPKWPWSTYLSKVNSYCSSSTDGGSTGGTPGGSGGSTASAIIIDSNNSSNDRNKGYIQLSANWVSTNSTAGYYGTGYYYVSTKAVSDGATFWFYVPSNQARTIDAWWTAGSNRSTTAPFVVYNAQGQKLATKSVNQTVNGNKWNELGTYNFTAGWNKVVLSRWTGEGKVVVADALRVR